MDKNKPSYDELEKQVKKLENKLELFEKFMEISPIHVFFKDNNLRALSLSKNFEQLINMPVEEMIGKTDEELFPLDFAKKMIEDDKKVLDEGKTIQKYEEFEGKTYSTVKFPGILNDNSVAILGYTMDITDIIKAEKALKESEQNLQLKNNEYASINEEYTALNEELRQINEQLLASKQIIEESEENLKEIFDNSLDNIFVIEVCENNRFLIKTINNAQAKLFNIHKSAMEGKFMEEILNEKDVLPILMRYRQCVETKNNLIYEVFNIGTRLVE